ncbi:hypothetical protein HAX54_026633 [Datura stramonium]|uniref:Uncharacterized protein n=1 Tax=Datura stramonium TaxID=4076 RepID=A0ABS8V3T2_DATST|nr:hypothetical protein [Datura stramonium]
MVFKFGAGLFLLIQVIILLDATHSWNDSWATKMSRRVCRLLVFFIVMTMILAFAFAVIALHPRSYIPALRAGSSLFLCLHHLLRDQVRRNSSDSEELESGKGSPEARPAATLYTFFHLIFALASMYSAMLLSGWTSSSESSELHWMLMTSVWVRICTEWVTADCMSGPLVAPLFFPDREFY